MRIQELAQGIHNLIRKHNLPELMFRAFDVLPEMVMKPQQAFQAELRGETEECFIEDLVGKINANMILPYPPGVPSSSRRNDYREQSSGSGVFVNAL